MLKKELLQKHYDMACHNLLCYSANYGMAEPKEGFEKEWKQAAEECEIIKAILDEYAGALSNKIKFIGTVSCMEVGYSKVKNEHYISKLIVHDADGNHRMFDINYDCGKELRNIYDEERHRRYEQEKDTEIVFTVNNWSQMIEHWEWKVK